MKSKDPFSPPFFSVIITTYNRKKLLDRAVSSLLNQKETDYEVVLIDDGSEDGTAELADTYKRKFHRFRYVYQENKGFIQAKNRGIFEATGKYLTFLDSDDEYAPDHLENRKKTLQHHPDIELLHGGAKVIGNQFVPDNDHPGKQILVTDCAISGTFFIKREQMLELGGFKGTPLSVDADFMERAQQKGLKIMKVDLPTYIYHRDTGSSVTLDMMKNKEEASR